MHDLTTPTRRGMLRTSLGLLAGTAVAATALAASGQAMAQDQKIDKKLVQYQDTPKNGAECDKCVNFVAPNACKIVNGDISPKGWCVAYAPKEG